jgi:hypothetical protein
MNCPNCGLALNAPMGCQVTGDPLYWCLSCGTIRTCEGEVQVPLSVRRPTGVDDGSEDGCPTCSHTLQVVYSDKARTISHCPRCGTMRSTFLKHVDDVVPSVMGRARVFGRTLAGAAAALWHKLGIRESIDRPENRPAVVVYHPTLGTAADLPAGLEGQAK